MIRFAEHKHVSPVEKWVERFSLGIPLKHELHLEFHGCRMNIRSNSEPLVLALKRYYRGFEETPRKTGPQIEIGFIERDEPNLDGVFDPRTWKTENPRSKEEYVDLPNGRLVRKSSTGMIFVFGGDVHLGCGPCIENCNQVVNFINNRFMQRLLRKDGYLLGHAAGVSYKGAGISLAGPSGSGKSTLALHLMSRDGDFTSNDRLMIRKFDNCVEMVGVPKLPRVNPGTIVTNEDLHHMMSRKKLEAAKCLNRRELRRLEEKHDVYIDECFGENRFRLSSRMNALVLLNWFTDGHCFKISKVNLRKRRELLSLFMKTTGLFHDTGFDQCLYKRDIAVCPDEEEYLDVLDECDVYEFSGNISFQDAADACMHYLKTGKMEH